MEFRLLGPVEAGDRGVDLPLGGGKQRALLALLLLNADRVVPVERIVDGLWGDDVPETAVKGVQIYVSRLRKVLPSGRLETRAPGYVLHVEPGELDLVRFEELFASGREALAAARPADAAEALLAALDLWRGPALAEFEEPFAVLEAARLEELRLTCLEQRIEADLALGRHGELTGELESLVTLYPLREGLRAQQLLALYRAGRQAEALAAYQEFRKRLDDELGIEPSQRLRDLERRMLQQDPALDEQPSKPATTSPSPGAHPAGPAGDRVEPVAPFVGRGSELTQLERFLAEAVAGHRQIVLLSGPAGIGKTSLVRAFLDACPNRDILVGRGQCFEQYGAGEAYMPILEALGRLCRGDSGSEIARLLAAHAPTWLGELPGVGEHPPESERGATSQERMLRELVEALAAISEARTLILLLEDLHWADASTIDALSALARRDDPARLLVLGTYRPQDARAASHPVWAAVRELDSRGFAIELGLKSLNQRAVVDYLESRFPQNTFPLELAELLHDRTDGHPLFLEKVVDSWAETGALVLDNGVWTLPGSVVSLSVDVPATIRQLIEHQLDQLDGLELELVEAASAAGTEFSSALVASACACDEVDAEARLATLEGQGRFVETIGESVWPDGTVSSRFRFLHDLYSEVTYSRLPPGRRTRLHRSIGERLENAYGDQADAVLAELAVHFLRGRQPEQAVAYLVRAAGQAFARSGHPEALAQLATALDALAELPAAASRDRMELDVRIELGRVLMAARGYSSPVVAENYRRAQELCLQLGDDPRLFPVLYGLWVNAQVAGRNDLALAFAEEFVGLATAQGHPSIGVAHRTMGWTLISLGRPAEARTHLEEALPHTRDEFVDWDSYLGDAEVAVRSAYAWALWLLGLADSAKQQADAAVAAARRRQHPFSLAMSLAYEAMLLQYRREPTEARALAEEARAVCDEHDIALPGAWALLVCGWSAGLMGEPGAGTAMIRRALERLDAMEATWSRSNFLVRLAETQIAGGRAAEALETLERARAVTEAGERYCEAEILRLRAELVAATGAHEAPETDLRNALEVARAQGARSLELRAAVSLARLWQAQRQTRDAHALLSPIVASFSEGLGTPDLLDAASLLEELGGPLHAPEPAPVSAAASPAPIVGRETELASLAGLLREASGGRRQLVFVSGEAGIGKTSLIDEFLRAADADSDVLVARGQCIDQRGPGEAYLPVLDALGRLGRDPSVDVKGLLARAAPSWLVQLPSLLDPGDLEALQQLALGATRNRMLREMIDALDELGRARTFVLVLEDLHWADYSTLDLLEALARRDEPARLLVVGTHRPPARSEDPHLVGSTARNLRLRGLASELALEALAAGEVDEYLQARLPGSEAPDRLGSRIRELTGGNPLFVEKVVEAWIDTGAVELREGRWTFASDLDGLTTSVPRSLRQLIEQRLADLDPGEQELLEAASVAGTEFAAAAAAAACERSDAAVEAALRRLAGLGTFVEPCGEESWPDRTVSARFAFTHDLCREVLYERLPAGLRARLHVRIGERLHDAYGPRAGEIAPELASHFVRGHDPARAVEQLQLAGARALGRIAYREAIDHLATGLHLIDELHAGPDRDLAELGLRLRLGPALFGVAGWASGDAERELVRAQELAEQLDRADERATALLLLGAMHEVRGDYARSTELLECSLALPGPAPSSGVLVDSREILACSLLHQGDYERALDQAETGLELWDGGATLLAAYGEIPGVSFHTWAALALWFLGRPDAAAERVVRAVALAQSERFAPARPFVLAQAAMVGQLRGEPAAALEHAERAIETASVDGHTLRLATGTILAGWARALAGEPEPGIDQVLRGIELSRSTGARMDDPYHLALLADARLAGGRPADALADLAEALSLVRTNRTYFYEPELHRLRGEALLALDRRGDAEAAFEEALERARHGGSPSLELRAALSAARLRLADGFAAEAAELVRAPYAVFGEGFDTPDLIAARALLERVSGGDILGPAPLLERADALAQLARALRSARAGTGRLVLVLGEAGVGKTSLVEEFLATRATGARVLRGSCDALLTPRALGPIVDIAMQAGGELARTMADGAPREAVFDALRDELSREPGTVVVLEDLHWADEGSLDVLSFLGRRIAQLPCLLVATAREEGSEALRTAVAELPPGEVSRLELTGLSPDAVDELARRAGRSSEGLHELTGGNAFFLTEVLATGAGQLPSTVRDAVAARYRRLSPAARALLDAVSVVPGQVEPALLEAVLGAEPDPGLEECLATGVLEAAGNEYRFRHEIARQAVEAGLSPLRRADLERRALEALVVDERADVARVVHHARLAGEDETVRRYAPAAAQAASAAGAHREALDHYRAALAVADRTDHAAHATLLEGLSEEAYLCGGAEEALDARRQALALRRASGDSLRIGDDLRWIARLLWWLGRRDEAEAAGAESIAVLEPEGPSRELAMALSSISQLLMVAWRPDAAVEYGSRALGVAREIGDIETIAHATTNVGSVLVIRDRSAEGTAMLEEAFALANGAGLHEHAARALLCLTWPDLVRRDLDAAEPGIERTLAYCDAHELIGLRSFALGYRAQLRLELGDWKRAEADAVEVLGRPERDVGSCAPLVVRGLLRARRGQPGASDALDEAQALAESLGEQQRLAPVAAARAELAWLSGDHEGVADAVRAAYEQALALEDPLSVSELAFWLWRSGELDSPPTAVSGHFRLSIEGDWRGAADAWERVGAPYARAEALSHADDGDALREAVELYESLGATVSAERLRRRLPIAARRRAPVEYARSGDLNIAYQVTGEGPVDLVLVPGFVSHLEQDWEEPRHAHFLDRLGSFSRLIRFDKRGTGLSDRPGGVPDLETRMDDLRAVLDATGSERAVLFGYSEGGALSILFTATYPEWVSALVLYGVFAKRIDPDDDYPWAPTREARTADITRLVDEWGIEANMREMCPSADEAMARWWGARCRAAASPGAIRALMTMNSSVDVRTILPSIHVPTLVIHRTGDVDTSVEEGRYVAARIPGATFSELPGADHFVGVDPDQILDVVEPFVLTVTGGAPPGAGRVLATVLMTDIVGSTETLSRVGDRAWTDLLVRHNTIVRGEVERFSGELIESTGDGVLALFDGPSRAIRCGEAIQIRLAALRLNVRVGVHTGEIERRPDGVRGIAVHLAARVLSEAGPGELMVTATTRDLVAGSGLAFTDRGERRLKGIEEPRRLYAVVLRA